MTSGTPDIAAFYIKQPGIIFIDDLDGNCIVKQQVIERLHRVNGVILGRPDLSADGDSSVLNAVEHIGNMDIADKHIVNGFGVTPSGSIASKSRAVHFSFSGRDPRIVQVLHGHVVRQVERVSMIFDERLVGLIIGFKIGNWPERLGDWFTFVCSSDSECYAEWLA